MPIPNTLTRNFTTLVSTTFDYRVRYWADNIFKEYPALNKFTEKRKQADGGNQIEMPVEYDATENAKALGSDMETIVLATPDPGSIASYPWATVADGVTIPDNAVSDNAGAEKVLDYVEFLMDNWEHRYQAKMSTLLWAASPAAADPNSIPQIITSAGTGTIGNINSSTQTWWQNKTKTSGSFAVVGMADIRNLYNTCSKGQNSLMPDLIVTEQTGFENFEAHLSARERIVLEDKGRKSQEVGYERLWFKRAEVVWDAAVTSGQWFFLNSDFIRFVHEKGRWLRKGDMLRPVDQLGYSILIDSRYNLCTNARLRLGFMGSVTYP